MRASSRRTCFPCNPHEIARVRQGGRRFHLHATFALGIAAACTTMGRRTVTTRANAHYAVTFEAITFRTPNDRSDARLCDRAARVAGAPSHESRASFIGEPRSASQPGPHSSGQRYASSRERAYACSRTAPR
ncbi:hypothetical protein AQ610_27710 [Burkholderia humptydooensis]|nr:hypothetical protein AQ610_27710 [Burkholderia humptydooensis]